ncbi:amidase signature domain-containing protein [Dichotomopilus funicola]|uniref:Amidase signature domain-containing protein n=1 Tax=Dichotomopilus funicola TaxID=1934379 RepID=A0AAN6ZJ23_9PEZI|nr:amidase signature domain-containing protein [Dichotomopilus funicola]
MTATIDDLQRLLSTDSGLTSKQLVSLYLARIYRHDDYLRAVISITPQNLLLQRAQQLDDERRGGLVRSPLHGIPVLLKDNIATKPGTGLDTTAGSFALVDSKPRENAVLVDKLLDAGAILLGKASLSELSWWKGSRLICGWNAVYGQAQSPYVRGGLLADDTFAGHSNPGGSSSGSAIGVAAGYVPFSIGTETFGSLMLPAGRAALYSLKPSRGIVSTKGVVPISRFSDAPGPMTKTAKDLAFVMDVLVDKCKTQVPKGGYISRVTGSWKGLRIGTLDPEVWNFGTQARKVLDPSMEQQLNDQVRHAYMEIERHADVFHNNIPMPLSSTLDLDGESCLMKIFEKDFQVEFEAYLRLCDTPKITTLGELIQFNRDHSDKELPPGNSNQEMLERCYNTNITEEQYLKYIAHVEKYGRELGLNAIMDKYNLNIIIGPLECDLGNFAASAGYPIASMPLGYLDYNGRPHGLGAVARAHEDGLLIQLQSAFEKTFPQRRPLINV